MRVRKLEWDMIVPGGGNEGLYLLLNPVQDLDCYASDPNPKEIV